MDQEIPSYLPAYHLTYCNHYSRKMSHGERVPCLRFTCQPLSQGYSPHSSSSLIKKNKTFWKCCKQLHVICSLGQKRWEAREIGMSPKVDISKCVLCYSVVLSCLCPTNRHRNLVLWKRFLKKLTKKTFLLITYETHGRRAVFLDRTAPDNICA